MQIKPVHLKTEKLSPNAPITSAEMAKLWAMYMGNSMGIRILSYFLKHVEDKEIKILLENGLNFQFH